jgi:hypothetical protein
MLEFGLCWSVWTKTITRLIEDLEVWPRIDSEYVGKIFCKALYWLETKTREANVDAAIERLQVQNRLPYTLVSKGVGGSDSEHVTLIIIRNCMSEHARWHASALSPKVGLALSWWHHIMLLFMRQGSQAIGIWCPVPSLLSFTTSSIYCYFCVDIWGSRSDLWPYIVDKCLHVWSCSILRTTSCITIFTIWLPVSPSDWNSHNDSLHTHIHSHSHRTY